MTIFQQNVRNLMWLRWVLWKSLIKVKTRGLHRGSISTESTSDLVQDVGKFLSFFFPVIHPCGTGATHWASTLPLSHTPTSKFICLRDIVKVLGPLLMVGYRKWHFSPQGCLELCLLAFWKHAMCFLKAMRKKDRSMQTLWRAVAWRWVMAHIQTTRMWYAAVDDIKCCPWVKEEKHCLPWDLTQTPLLASLKALSRVMKTKSG